jgi:hypothetical protein
MLRLSSRFAAVVLCFAPLRAGFDHGRQSSETAKLSPALRDGIAYALCHAA